MLEQIKNLGHQGFEVLVVQQNVFCTQRPNVIGYLLHSLGEDVSLAGDIQVELNVIGIYLANLCVHLKVVVCLRLFVLIRVEQMLFAFQILINLAVHFDVLERTVEHNEHLGVDCPVIQVGDMAFKSKLEGPEWAHLVLMLPIETFQ